MRRYVLGFLFSEDETRIALIRKTRPTWQAGRLNGIGGHVGRGEDFNQAMARESREELGASATLTWRRFATVESHRVRDTDQLDEKWIMACYRAPDALAHLPSHNDVGEAFETHDVDLVPLMIDTVNNLSWLVAMAHSRQEADWPFHVREQHYVGDDDA